MTLCSFRWLTIWILFALPIHALLHAAGTTGEQIFSIRDSGVLRSFEIAYDELYTETGPTPLSLTLLPLLDSLDIRQRAAAIELATGRTIHLVLYPTGVPRSEWTRRVLTRTVLVELEPTGEPARLALETGALEIERFKFAPHHFVFHVGGPPDAALEFAAAVRTRPDVVSAEPLLGRKMSKRLIPDDPLFPKQWHLLQRSPPGATPGTDLNLTNVWDRFRGSGVTIAIVDDGVEFDHPDLTDSLDRDVDYDYRDDDDDSSPTGPEDHHGTAVAGIVAARIENKIGIAGVAPEARLISIRLIGGDDQTDDQSASALTHEEGAVHISNNSWGAPDSGQLLDGPGTLAKLALKNGVQHGRDGKGTIFVWSAGNGGELQDNANYDGFANSIYTIAVAGITDQGGQAVYSEPGACIIVSAPSGLDPNSDLQGIATTDRLGDEGLNFAGALGDLDDPDYTQLFGGTSAAAPMVTGIIALMLEANPELGWRDVQEILIRSARVVSKDDADWIENGAGFHFNHKFGAGALDAAAAVQMAEDWSNLPPRTTHSAPAADLPISIPDNNPTGVTLEFTAPNMRVEHATVTVNISHSGRGDLGITLISPAGTHSRLAERHRDLNADFEDWTFMSTFHWGENARGIWKLQVADHRSSRTGKIMSAELQLYGIPLQSLEPTLTVSDISDAEFKFILSAPSAGDYEVQSSTDLIRWDSVKQVRLAAGENIELAAPRNDDTQFFRAIAR